MPYTDGQMLALSVTERVGASLSFLGCSFMILTFVFSNRFRRPVNRIMFYASIGNLIYTIPGFIGLSGLQMGSQTSLCQAQAFLIQAALPADALWNLSMALNVYFTVFKGNDMARLQKREPYYLVINSALPFIIAVALLFIQTPDRGHVYGNAAIWCWITPQWEFLRIVACYGIAWLCIITAFTIYISVGLKIRKERQKLLRPSLENGTFGQTHLTKLDIVAQTTVQTSVIEDISKPAVSSKHSGPVRQLSYKPASNLRYQVHISSTTGRLDQMIVSDPVRKYTKSCMLFFISLLITWVPSSINRLWALAHPNQSAPFGLAYAAAFVLQLTGFWNSAVYIMMSRTACIELFQLDILPKFRGKKNTSTQMQQPRSPLLWNNVDGEAPSRASLGTIETRGSKDRISIEAGTPDEEEISPPLDTKKSVSWRSTRK